MDTKLKSIKAQILRGEWLTTEEIITAIAQDYKMSETQARIVYNRATGNTTQTNQHPTKIIDKVRDIAEFTTLMENNGVWWGSERSEYKTVTVNNQGAHLTILFQVQRNDQSRLDPEVRLIANVKMAAKEYRERYTSKRKDQRPFTWLDVTKIPESIGWKYGFRVISATPAEILDAYENLLE